MVLTKIFLQHFRNYSQLKFEPLPGPNLIIAGNAQGKSNLLEAIYFLAASRSHRTPREQEILQWSASESYLAAEISRENRGQVYIEIKFGPQIGKIIKINSLRRQKVSQLIGEVNVVVFTADDLQIIKGEPQQRRRFLDLNLSQESRGYFFNLLQYNKVLGQRNKLLKEIREDREKAKVLPSWTEELTRFGAKIIESRLKAVKELDQLANLLHHTISDNQGDLHLQYCPNIPITDEDLEESFKAKIEQVEQEEIARGVTLIGPHRDDISFLLDGVDLRIFGSQGQQRTAAIALKLAELQRLKNKIKEPPILLLDDVFSELDEKRQKSLSQALKGLNQVFITATSLKEIPEELRDQATKFELQDGFIRRLE